MQNKQQEYLKQREKLKYVTPSNLSRKALDPDIMIEQLISDKETFKFNSEPPLPYVVPKWLKVEYNLVPAVYEQVWQAVKLGPTFQFCDTKIITHLFTTSGLSLEKLGYLWSLTNVNSPGFLTQQELYIILALIALVQTGYHVNDIAVINSINHPILPQLDYSFLNITVANPSINRSVKNNDEKPNNSIIFNGFSSFSPSNSVSLHVKPLNDAVSSKHPSKNVNVSSNASVLVESRTINTPLNTSINLRKSDMDVSFAIPERNKVEMDFDFIPKVPVSEIDVDFPIQSVKVDSKCVPPIVKTNFRSSIGARKADFDAWSKISNNVNHNFLNVMPVSNSLEPRSLDLPKFSESTMLPDEDEFTEFQSATLNTIDEYSDFQSASTITKLKIDNVSGDNSELFGLNHLNSNKVEFHEVNSFASNNSNSKLSKNSNSKLELMQSNLRVERHESNFLSDEASYPKTSLEADKYDVFRALMEENKEENEKSPVNDEENEDDDEEDDDEEFGEFYTADIKPNVVKPEVSIKDRCLEACLRLLQEGLRIFSSISSEKVVIEVLSEEKGCRYFSQLKIVYDTSQRFQRQFESTQLNDAIHSTWAKLSKYTKYISNEDLLDEVGESRCYPVKNEALLGCILLKLIKANVPDVIDVTQAIVGFPVKMMLMQHPASCAKRNAT